MSKCHVCQQLSSLFIILRLCYSLLNTICSLQYYFSWMWSKLHTGSLYSYADQTNLANWTTCLFCCINVGNKLSFTLFISLINSTCLLKRKKSIVNTHLSYQMQNFSNLKKTCSPLFKISQVSTNYEQQDNFITYKHPQNIINYI